MDFKAEAGPENVVTIKVVGVGGAGNNVVNSGAIALGTIAVAVMSKAGFISNTGVFIFIAIINLCTAIYLIPLRKIKF